MLRPMLTYSRFSLLCSVKISRMVYWWRLQYFSLLGECFDFKVHEDSLSDTPPKSEIHPCNSFIIEVRCLKFNIFPRTFVMISASASLISNASVIFVTRILSLYRLNDKDTILITFTCKCKFDIKTNRSQTWGLTKYNPNSTTRLLSQDIAPFAATPSASSVLNHVNDWFLESQVNGFPLHQTMYPDLDFCFFSCGLFKDASTYASIFHLSSSVELNS